MHGRTCQIIVPMIRGVTSGEAWKHLKAVRTSAKIRFMGRGIY